MTFKLPGIMLLSCSVLMCGCIGPRIAYQGERFAPTTAVALISGQDQLRNYHSMGRAVISGQYQDYSYDELLNDLRKKAEKVGADAVYVKAYVIVPDGSVRDDQVMDTTPNDAWAMDDDSSDGWMNLTQQLTFEDGMVGNRTSSIAADTPVYRRVVKAIFLKRNR